MQEELQGIIREYETRGYFDEIMALLEAGLSLERAHVSPLNLLSMNNIQKFHRWGSSQNSPFYIANISRRNASIFILHGSTCNLTYIY